MGYYCRGVNDDGRCAFHNYPVKSQILGPVKPCSKTYDHQLRCPPVFVRGIYTDWHWDSELCPGCQLQGWNGWKTKSRTSKL